TARARPCPDGGDRGRAACRPAARGRHRAGGVRRLRPSPRVDLGQLRAARRRARLRTRGQERPGASVVSTPHPELVTALQRALAGEHAALYAYEVIGGRLDADTPPQRHARAAYRHHRSRRDDLTVRLRRLGQAPTAAHPGYDLPFEV